MSDLCGGSESLLTLFLRLCADKDFALGVQGVKYHDGGLWNASDVQGVPQKLSADRVRGLRGVDEARVEPASLLSKIFHIDVGE